MKIDPNCKYSKTHEWVRLEGPLAVMGFTDYAQEQLSDIVFVELPPVGAGYDQFATLGTVESVKAASDYYAPLSGTVVAVNEALLSEPALVNTDPYGAAWFVKLQPKDLKELDNLMDSAAYAKWVEEETAKGGH
ncbi:MAG: glycine cleavage system protein GcvH [Chloroflexi bacterium]|nr:glycine cleavage system protein GcvH [Chloroflexota bacterium]